MYYNTFKNERISALGFGGLRMPLMQQKPPVINRTAAQHLIDMAMEHGINYFDTAMTYQNGDSERFLGEALASYPRESYYFTTKYYALDNPDIKKVFYSQLLRCNMDYFDFYLFHGMNEKNFSNYVDEKNLEFLLEQKEKA